MMHTHKNTIGAAVLALIIGIGIGYTGGKTLAHSSVSQNTPGGFAGNYGGVPGGMMRGGNRGTGGFLTGTVATKDSGSITLNTRDGSSHVVFVTPATSVSKSVSGTMTDVSVGATVIVSGTTNSDGSVSATLLQLRPAAAPAAQ